MYTLKKLNVVKIVNTEYDAKKLIAKGFMLQKPYNNNDNETVIATETIQKQSNCNNNHTSNGVNVDLSAESKVNIKESKENINKTEIETSVIDEDGFDYSVLRKAELIKVAEEKGLKINERMNKKEILDLMQGV